MAEIEGSEGQKIQVEIEVSTVHLQYCNYAMAQATDEDFILSLFQIPPPLSPTQPVKGHCLGRFVFTRGHSINTYKVLRGILKTQGILPKDED